jgi:hypothetical protein
MGSDCNQYGRLLENLKNDYTQGQDHYPKTVTAAYSLLTNWKKDGRNIMRMIGPENNGVSFMNINGAHDTDATLTTAGRKVPHKEKTDISHILACHWCGKKGHYATACKNGKVKKEAEAMLLTAGVTAEDFEEADHVPFEFLQTASHADYRSVVVLNQPSGAVPKAWILLDNQSTVNFYNKDLLRNVSDRTPTWTTSTATLVSLAPTWLETCLDTDKYGIIRMA